MGHKSILCVSDSALYMAQAVTCGFLIAEVWALNQSRSYGICDRCSGTREDCSPSTTVLPATCHSTSAPYLLSPPHIFTTLVVFSWGLSKIPLGRTQSKDVNLNFGSLQFHSNSFTLCSN